MSYPTKEWMLNHLRHYVKKGNFFLSSGRKSGYYIDVKSALTSMTFLEGVMNSIPFDVTDYDVFVGLEMGSIPLAVALAYSLIPIKGSRYAIFRKDGSMVGIITPIDQVLVLEDVTTTGRSLLRAATKIEVLFKPKSINVLAIVDRDEGAIEYLDQKGYTLSYLFTATDLLQGRRSKS